MSAKTAKLADIAQLNPRVIERPTADTLVSFVPMAGLDANTGRTWSGEDRRFADVAKGYTQFADGDLLVAKITPCFENGKIAQARLSHNLGAGSTEFHVIRPDRSLIDDRYLLHFLRQPSIRVAGERRMTGSGGQRRVPEAYLADLAILLLPISEQRRIAQILDGVDALRAKRAEAISLLDDLIQCSFVDMFGDSSGMSSAWPTRPVEDMCEVVVDCVNRTAPTVDYETPYKMVRTTNVKSGRVDLTDVRFVTDDTFHRWNRRLTPRKGDVILTREAPVGEAGILSTDDNVFLGQRLMLYRVDPSKATAEYLLAAFRSPLLHRQFEKHGSGSTVKHLPLPACRSFEIPLPPLDLQREFENRVRSARAVKAKHQAHLTQLDALFASVQYRAFRGELFEPVSV